MFDKSKSKNISSKSEQLANISVNLRAHNSTTAQDF